jgi:hypothetical protein
VGKPDDIKVDEKSVLKWDNFVNKSFTEALPAIYPHATSVSKNARDGHWAGIRNKGVASMVVRSASCLIGPIVRSVSSLVGPTAPSGGAQRGTHRRVV